MRAEIQTVDDLRLCHNCHPFPTLRDPIFYAVDRRHKQRPRGHVWPYVLSGRWA